MVAKKHACHSITLADKQIKKWYIQTSPPTTYFYKINNFLLLSLITFPIIDAEICTIVYLKKKKLLQCKRKMWQKFYICKKCLTTPRPLYLFLLPPTPVFLLCTCFRLIKKINYAFIFNFVKTKLAKEMFEILSIAFPVYFL